MSKKLTEEQLAVLHRCEHAGYRVTDARCYFEQMNPQKPRLCQVIRTPYIYAVNPLVALTSTSRKDVNRDARGYLNTGLVELFAVSGNDSSFLTVAGFEAGVKAGKLKSLADLDREAVMALATTGGKKLSQRDVFGEVQRFASVCAEFSHMKVLDEYMEEAVLIHGMIGGKTPSEDDYWKVYVPGVIEEMQKYSREHGAEGEQYRLMGRVTTLREAMAWRRQRGHPPEEPAGDEGPVRLPERIEYGN